MPAARTAVHDAGLPRLGTGRWPLDRTRQCHAPPDVELHRHYGRETRRLETASAATERRGRRDYRDVAVLAFPTPQDDTGSPPMPASDAATATTSHGKNSSLAPLSKSSTQPRHARGNLTGLKRFEATKLRTIEFSSINGFNTIMSCEPGISGEYRSRYA